MLHDGRPGPVRAQKFPVRDERQEIGGYYNSLYGASFRQIEMMNGHLLHQAGAHGEGILLGILDAGFLDADSLPAFAELRARNGIVFTRDLAYNDGDVYHDHWHGRSVLSCIAGHLPGQLLGTAPGVDVALLRTEVAETEYPWEEDNWVSGAELADSLGCDVLNSSLGYTQFDDSTMDHAYADLDGLTLRISIAAGIAARKGMIPVNSAGNSGGGPWHYIGAPADAIDILAVGAVGEDRQQAPFSSFGPSADGRVKPDVSAMGFRTVGLGAGGELALINGTSFSSPLVAGSTACLWQLHPDATAQRIMAAVRASASQHDGPDASLGYGIPDFWRAHLLLGGTDLTDLRASDFFQVWPVPFSDHFELLLFTGASDHVSVKLHDTSGRAVWEATDAVDPGTYVRLRVGDEALARLVAGSYLLSASTGSAEFTRPLMKIEP
jgi:subtilisin family serine protease